MGALRTTGVSVFIAGIVYFAIGLLVTVDFFYGMFGGMTYSTTGGARFMVSILGQGVFWGAVLVFVGLVIFYVSARMREKAATSS